MPNPAIRILGVPLDLGQQRRGVDMGPSALRAARLQSRLRAMGRDVEDLGDLPVVIPETQSVVDDRARYLDEIASVCHATAKRVSRTVAEGRVPLVIGGDHSIAVGTLAGVAQGLHEQGRQLGLIWLDAHGDMNTLLTTPSGNIHGMGLACAVGLGSPTLAGLISEPPIVAPEHVALVGVRDLDPGEKDNLRDSGVHVFTMRNVDERGMRNVIEQAIAVASGGTAGFHVSLDMDVLDPTEAPGVGTPCPGGISYREAHLAMEMIADSRSMLSFEVVEVNPILDAANRTGLLAVELALSAFGKQIV